MSGIYPEFVRQSGGKRGLNESWDIVRCSTTRGNPMTNIVDRKMAVPLDADELARVIRAHELMHVRVSPSNITPWVKRGKASLGSLMVAEETRVNYLIKDFKPEEHLYDPNDYANAKEQAKRKDLTGLIRATAATWGTRSAPEVLKAVGDAVINDGADPELVGAVSNLQRKLTAIYKQKGFMASSDKFLGGSRVLTKGFLLTEAIAKLLDTIIRLAEETGKIPSFLSDDDGPTDQARCADATFAPLVFGEANLSRIHNGNMGKVKFAAPTGRHPRRIHRLLTDPYKRIFDRTRRENGAVVLIDQSGSMRLHSSDVLKILDASPGATIATYRHQPNSKNIPNIWILAKDGKMVTKLPEQEGEGNGVDGPALRWAMTARRKINDTILWVCDGQVTDGKHDSTYSHLTAEARALARKGKVIMRGNIEAAIELLKKMALGRAESGPQLLGALNY